MRRVIHGEIELNLPAEWIDASTIFLAGPPQNSFAPNVSVVPQRRTNATTVQSYAADQKAVLMQEFADRQYLVLEEGDILVGNLPAYQRFHRFRMEEGIDVIQWQVYLLRGFEAITLTATDRRETFESSFPILRDMILSCEWIDKDVATGA